MGKSCKYDPQSERYPVDGLQSKGHYEMEGAETSRDRDEPPETAGKHKEQGIDHIEGIQVGESPHRGRTHQPVHGPYYKGIGKEQPFPGHPQTAPYAHKQSSADRKELTAECVVPPVADYEQYKKKDYYKRGKAQPPDTERNGLLQRYPHLLREEAPELVPAEDKETDHENHHGDHIPAALEHHSPQHLVIRGKLLSIGVLGGIPRNHTAAHELPDAREDEIGYITYIHRIECRGPFYRRVYREQKSAPPEPPDIKGKDAGRHRKQDISPPARAETGYEVVPLDTAEREPQQHQGHPQRNDIF